MRIQNHWKELNLNIYVISSYKQFVILSPQHDNTPMMLCSKCDLESSIWPKKVIEVKHFISKSTPVNSLSLGVVWCT